MCPSLAQIGAALAPGSCVLDEPAVPAALWGRGTEVLAAFGEATIICGPDGVGKTTLAGSLVRALLGLAPGEVLGYPVWPVPQRRRVLYLAMDRPRQALRALRRLFTEAERPVLDERLAVWKGPPPSDLARDPEMLTEMCRMAGAAVCFTDSLKDAAIGLAEDQVGAAWNRARQQVIASGTELVELHHPRKATGDNPKPKNISDVYGSRWITAGAGSVLYLWGKPGDAVVELSHLKQPADEITGLRMVIDAEAGSVRAEGGDIIGTLAAQGYTAITVQLAAQVMFATLSPDRNQAEKARRALRRLEAQGKIAADGSTGRAGVWRPVGSPPQGTMPEGIPWSVLWDIAQKDDPGSSPG
jgi:replicative DNA helicase